MPALIRPKSAVTVSIIAMSFTPRPGENDILPRAVKRIPRPDRKSGLTDALVQQIYQEASCERTRRLASDASIPSTPWISGPGPTLIPHPTGPPLSAVFGLRYLHILMRRWAAGSVSRPVAQSRRAAGGMVIGADGDSAVRLGYPDGAQRCCCGGMPRPRQLRLIGQVRQPGRSQVRRFLHPASCCFRRTGAEGRGHLSRRQALYRRGPGLRAGRRYPLSRGGFGLLVWQ